MAAPSVGTVQYKYLQSGKEATHGTTVAATRRWYATGGWAPNNHPQDLHRGGTAIPRIGQISQGLTVDLSIKEIDGASYNGLVFPLSQLKSGQTGTGGSADKVWAFAPNRTTPEDYETYTWEYGDETQEYEGGYGFCKGFTLEWDGSSRDNMTQLSMDWMVQTSTKSTKTASLTNTDVRIPAYLWTVQFSTAQSTLAAASPVTSFLRKCSIAVDTGLRPQFYSDGTAGYAQVTRSAPVDATITMTVDSNAQAVSQFYDKAISKTVDFVQFTNTGPALGGTNYAASGQFAVVYDVPTIADADIDGVNTYTVVAHLVDDATWAQGLSFAVTNAIAALTA